MNINIYSTERLDGLEEKLIQNNSLAYYSQLKTSNLKIDKSILNNIDKAAAGFDIQYTNDLAPVDTILASVGWNNNTDVFLSDELWAARKTPILKPVNLEHENKKIIGVMHNAYALDINGNRLDFDSDQHPEVFDLAVSSVIYTKWDDDDFEKQIAEMLVEIAEGEWYVSMECLFPDFDYALITPTGDRELLERTEETSYLTKHLRAYGGTGEYNNYKLGRAFKNFIFSAKGFVRKPANPRSIVLNTNNKPEYSLVTASQKTRDELNTENIMADTMVQETISELKEQNKALAKQLDEAKSQAAEEAKKSYEKQIAELKETSEKQVEEAKAELEETQNELKEKTEAYEKLETEKSEADKKLEEALASIEKVEKERIFEKRVAQLVEVGMEKEEASTKVEKFENFNEEQFNDVVEMAQAAFYKEDEKKKKKEEEDKAKASDGVTPEDVDEETTETATASVTPDGSEDVTTGPSDEEYAKGIASWLNPEDKEDK